MRSTTRTVATAARPVTAAGRRLMPGPALTIVGWHRVDGARSEGLSTAVDTFREHLDVIEEWGGRVLTLDEAVAGLDAGSLPERAVVLTFDDGYANVLDNAWPILQERGLPATMFAVSGFMGTDRRFPWDQLEPPHERHRLATPEQIRAAADAGLDVGSHTVTHPWLPRLDDTTLAAELLESRLALEDLLGRPVTSMAYPTGGWDRRVRAATGAAGYRVGITVDRGRSTRRTDRLSLRRSFAPHDPGDLRLILDGAYTYLWPLDRWRRRTGPEW